MSQKGIAIEKILKRTESTYMRLSEHRNYCFLNAAELKHVSKAWLCH